MATATHSEVERGVAGLPKVPELGMKWAISVAIQHRLGLLWRLRLSALRPVARIVVRQSKVAFRGRPKWGEILEDIPLF